MMRRHNRLLVAFYVVTDALLAAAAFVLAYLVRFESGLEAPKGIPPFGEYVALLPFVGMLVPLAYHIQGLYRLRRGRSRVDDFFAVFVGTSLAGVMSIGGTRTTAPTISPTPRRTRAPTRSPRGCGRCFF